MALAPNPMPQPDALFYGVALRDGTPLTSGTLTAILPRGGTVTTEIAPITGTTYNYALPVPLGYYDTADDLRRRLRPGGRDSALHGQRRARPAEGHRRGRATRPTPIDSSGHGLHGHQWT